MLILAGSISGLIANSYTHWWAPLANLTNTLWDAVAQGTVRAISYRIPMWALLIAVVLIALTWYAKTSSTKAKSSGLPQSKTPDFRAYREDYFDGVRCRWDYTQRYDGQYEIGNILCFCQQCDFVIGKPNDHLQDCPSCSGRAVGSDRRPYQSGFSGLITGYQRPGSSMPFEEFIRREIDRRLRKDAWQK